MLNWSSSLISTSLIDMVPADTAEELNVDRLDRISSPVTIPILPIPDPKNLINTDL